MPHPSWNDSYASGQLPWDTGQPEPLLVEFVTSGGVSPARTLEIGAGTGTNAIWLAERGFDLLGVDVSPLAVEQARAKLKDRDLRCRFAPLDFPSATPPDAPFRFVFDRGCLRPGQFKHVETSASSGSPQIRTGHPVSRRCDCDSNHVNHCQQKINTDYQQPSKKPRLDIALVSFNIDFDWI